ncbi:hypothetical protein Gferi_07310 [Geosporobacter ferrireducens]|uniref:Uncharacterized protein n=1 Tax=Geosporobacter ferrireducens TaxID=1424294 RepID=A0A1D8GER0_9FIRM|nr:hypothetical protein Gferi_07310 [Geosporobacter ferrireducens]
MLHGRSSRGDASGYLAGLWANLSRSSDDRRGFIYALSAAEIGLSLAAFLPFQTPLPSPAATLAERITHYTLIRKVVCQRVPLWKPYFECRGFALPLKIQKTGYQLYADSPSFVVTFRLPTAQSESFSILFY